MRKILNTSGIAIYAIYALALGIFVALPLVVLASVYFALNPWRQELETRSNYDEVYWDCEGEAGIIHLN